MTPSPGRRPAEASARATAVRAKVVFYGFFALGLLCVLYIMAYENFRHADRPTLAARVQRLTRIAFWAAIVSTAAIAGTIFGGTLLN